MLAMYVNCKRNNMAQKSNSTSTRARKINVVLPDGRNDGEYNGVGFLEISKSFVV